MKKLHFWAVFLYHNINFESCNPTLRANLQNHTCNYTRTWKITFSLFDDICDRKFLFFFDSMKGVQKGVILFGLSYSNVARLDILKNGSDSLN